MLNLWVALCKGVPGLPRDLRLLSYREHSIERTIRNQDQEHCRPELVICSDRCAHSALFEWKRGPNTEADQLRRYSRLGKTELVQLGMIPAAACRTFDVVIVGKEEHAERLVMGVQQGGYPFPVLAVNDREIRLVHNRFNCDGLNCVFAPSLPLDLSLVPLSFIPINEESEAWEVAEVVIPHLVERMLARDTMVKASSICTSVCRLWDIMDGVARQAMQANVCIVLQQAAVSEFMHFLRWKKLSNQDCAVEFVNNPVKYHGDKRGGAYRRLQNAARGFQDRLVSGRTFEIAPTLFDDMEQ